MIHRPASKCDFYKTGHRPQYPDDTELVYANLTARANKLSNLPNNNDKLTFFGLQYFIKHFLQDQWREGFFLQPKEEVIADYKRRMDTSLGPDAVPVDHLEALHDLGYLPVEIRALPEGARVNMRVPVLTIKNTLPEFFWLTNYLETILSAYLWGMCTSASTAKWYKDLFDQYAEDTGGDPAFTQWQGHDFSFRGMWPEAAAMSGAAHLTSFTGTDTIPAIDLLEDYYGANAEKEMVGGSVPATEHSVMCMGGKEDEIETFRRLITKLYPSGIVSIVSDTWDFWKVVTEYAAILKPEIMARAGNPYGNKVVFRPDSGDPVKVICGDPTAPLGSPARKGAVQCLWDVFGGTETSKGYKLLDSHVGLIYGDSITPERAQAILKGLKANGFASTNVVFGIGSFTYQFVTRDTYGFAVKSTYGIVKGEGREIFKDPVTDNGIKRSARGLLQVRDGVLHDQQETDDGGDLQVVFRDGELLREQTLADIRERLKTKKPVIQTAAA